MEKKEEAQRANIVVIGPRQSGKRSIVNRIFQLFCCPKRDIDKYTYDKWKEDLAAGKTIDLETGPYYAFSTQRYIFIFSHGIGHPRFLGALSKKNVPKVAILVVSAVTEEFDKNCAEAIEQLELMSNFGISKVIVLVTKMDLIQYDQAKFNAIQAIIEHEISLKKLRLMCVKYLPVSAISDLNLAPKPGLADLHAGPDFQTLLNSLPRDPKLENLPMRFPIEEIYKIAGMGYCATGGILSGKVSSADEAVVAPEQYVASIKAIENHHDELTVTAGTSVGMYFRFLSTELRKGQVVGLTKDSDPPKPVKDFTVMLYVSRLTESFAMNKLHPIKCHNALVDCKITDLIGKVDPQYGTVQKFGHNKNISINDFIIVRFEPTSPLCVELYSKFPKLGQITIQNGEEPFTAKGLIITVNNLEAPMVYPSASK